MASFAVFFGLPRCSSGCRRRRKDASCLGRCRPKGAAGRRSCRPAPAFLRPPLRPLDLLHHPLGVRSDAPPGSTRRRAPGCRLLGMKAGWQAGQGPSPPAPARRSYPSSTQAACRPESFAFQGLAVPVAQAGPSQRWCAAAAGSANRVPSSRCQRHSAATGVKGEGVEGGEENRWRNSLIAIAL